MRVPNRTQSERSSRAEPKGLNAESEKARLKRGVPLWTLETGVARCQDVLRALPPSTGPKMPDRQIPLSILVIDENRLRAAVIEDGLRDAGYGKLTVVHDVVGIARKIAETAPDVIVIDLENPNRDMLESMFQLSRAVKRPIAMFVDRSDQASIEAAVEAGVSAYVVDGLKRERVKPIIDMAISRFNAFARMARELEEARSQLESRKLIDRAKGILMSTRGLSEADAYALLRKTAMNQNRKISEIAESLITAAGLLAPPEE